MRLRNLFMILLLCMTVGMFGVSCTGDDGAQGAKGDTGEQGPPGDDGADAGDATSTYDFLKAWGGGEKGEISCSDDILTGDAAFPGPAMLMPDVTANGPNPTVEFAVQCSENLFRPLVATDSIKVGAVTVNDATSDTDATIAANEIAFVATGRLTGANAIVTESETEPTSTKRATSTVETKRFVGGVILADMSTTGGNDEVLERHELYSNCGVGTPPSDIRGEWRAVKITKVVTQYSQPGVDVLGTETGETGNGPATTTTTKVCVKLDSTPGVVKCFIEEDGPVTGTGDAKQQIALYDAETGATAVAPLAGPDGMLSTPSGATSSTPDDTLFDVTGDDVEGLTAGHLMRTCLLFEEGLQ